MDNKGILAAYGITDRSPIEVSESLKRLNLSHTLIWRDGVRMSQVTVNGLCREQPVWPIVVDSVRSLTRASVKGNGLVYMVTDSRAALGNTNLANSLWPENRPHETFTDSVATVIQDVNPLGEQTWELKTREPSLMDYVNGAVKPSQLNDFQTLVNKINPYTLRKEVQAMCIGYLAGTVKPQTLKAKLESTYKLQPLMELMKATRTRELKEAVAQAKSGTPMEVVCKSTGFQSFELTYLIKAADLHKVPKTKGKRGS